MRFKSILALTLLSALVSVSFLSAAYSESSPSSSLAFKSPSTQTREGNAESHYQLALKYQNNGRTPQDRKKAFELYKKAADQGHVKAQNNLGVCYESGDGVEANVEKAIFWYQKASENGFEPSYKNLGNLYYNKKDYPNALLWLTKAADSGDVNAQTILGNMYKLGQGVQIDKDKAAEYYQRAAEQGAAEAEFNLGIIYQENSDYKSAFHWYQKASNQNIPEADLNLARLYYRGLGVEKDFLRAGRLYKKAADGGLAQSQKFLSEIEEECIQPYAPTGEQVEACLISAGAGSTDAYKLLTAYYFFGQGVEKDPIEALAWGLLTPSDLPPGEKDEVAVRAFAVTAKLTLTLSKEDIEAATAKANKYRKEYMQENISNGEE